jgi:hypothetical protein
MDSKLIIGAVRSVTKVWAKQRKSEERQAGNLSRRSRVMTRCSSRYTLKDAAHEFMEAAYMKASANNTLPANARQIMYAARGPIQDATGEALDDKYFTQTLLPEFMRACHLKTKDWDVVFDARGHFHEPHTEKSVNLGTIAVRQYLGERPSYGSDSVISNCPLWPTSGPKHRFSAVLFLEKEGFNPLLEKVELAKRFDIGIMSTKGMSVTAARLLVDRVCGDNNIPLLVLHDFDKAGFSILGTLTRSSARYRFKNRIKVIDLGLRLQDVEEMELESESFSITDNASTRRNLCKNGATEEEIEFLMDGNRVELNAMSTSQLIEWLEKKLLANGIKKVVPDGETLEQAYRRSMKHELVQQRIAAIEEKAEQRAKACKVPTNLKSRVVKKMKDYPSLPWDKAVELVVSGRLGGAN